MRFGATRGGYGNRPVAADPFKQVQAAGPGVGAAPGELFTAPMTKRRRFDNQALGDTPPRDGPFAPSAQSIAKINPPRTRKRSKRNKQGPNPFGGT